MEKADDDETACESPLLLQSMLLEGWGQVPIVIRKADSLRCFRGFKDNKSPIRTIQMLKLE